MVVVAVRLLSMFICSYSGYRIASLLNANYFLRAPQQTLSIILGIVLGILAGYVFGGIIGRAAADTLANLESVFSGIPPAELFFGLAGALGGLLIALLPSFALFRFGYPGYILSILLFAALSLVGMQIGISKKAELSALFRLGPSLGGQKVSGETRILDTSVIVDGRVIDISKCGFLEGNLLVPRFVLTELQMLADSADTLKRSRGRRGLDVLNTLQLVDNVNVEITDRDFPEAAGVDAKLIQLSQATGIPLISNDFNLKRVAEIQDVMVYSINELASAMKPEVLPGEDMKVRIIREGKEVGQGVGYLDDGTMIVIEGGNTKVGLDVTVVATSVLQTPAGKMIFAELREDSQGE